MANASINKVDVNNPRVINLVANAELTVKFSKNIQSVSIVNLSNNAIFCRNDGELATTENVNCIKLDASFKGFDLYSSTFFNEISFISSVNSQIQLLNIR
ncbi:hypothetical protein [Clostridium brassicae]|uniref:SbsA Ig-like domain-containing protein n=1 Tax=Clostridium brassicae TaxID=2999072 RepID=A0ABT4D9I2_9CLOT|nr:hypothetical protein [Clostridium brassicae]MCY6957841.1 hypothetical protein [Clostridium brassicae]